MHQTLIECQQLTQQLFDLSRIAPEQLSDEQHEEITTLLGKREHLLPQLQKPVTDEEKQVAAIIVEQSNEISNNLTKIKKHIQLKIKNLKKKEQSNKQYLGYNNAAVDGYFYDKRR